jgi:hypothetical protein
LPPGVAGVGSDAPPPHRGLRGAPPQAEHSFTWSKDELGDPERLRLPLRLGMPAEVFARAEKLLP